eukprot:TRINITY_DN30738_c0_g1_i1.p1 TRINITY_DN30738_c0_g1~~TRINITY_DN30738_c0_g1_i1.p1  ORF type:complete len:298 (+),score=67.53 TRINITY_DN30738_c0_g1_i1:109-894(+)
MVLAGGHPHTLPLLPRRPNQQQLQRVQEYGRVRKRPQRRAQEQRQPCGLLVTESMARPPPPRTRPADQAEESGGSAQSSPRRVKGPITFRSRMVHDASGKLMHSDPTAGKNEPRVPVLPPATAPAGGEHYRGRPDLRTRLRNERLQAEAATLPTDWWVGTRPGNPSWGSPGPPGSPRPNWWMATKRRNDNDKLMQSRSLLGSGFERFYAQDGERSGSRGKRCGMGRPDNSAALQWPTSQGVSTSPRSPRVLAPTPPYAQRW